MEETERYRNILVYRMGHLGDTIVALPAFREIRKRFPDAAITLLTNADAKNKNYVAAQSVLPERGLFDEYIAYDNSAGKLKKALIFSRLLLELRRRRFECVFYLPTRIRTDRQIERDLRFFRAAGIKKVFGAEYVRQKKLDYALPGPLPKVEPEYEFLLRCLEFENKANDAKIDHDPALTHAEKAFGRRFLEENCGRGFERKLLIAVAPGSKWDSKKWFEERFIEVLEKLCQEYPIHPVIFGGKEDFETGERILSKLPCGTNAAGRLGIREAMAALEFCRLYLGNDTGTMHMAAAVGVPCVAVFAAIDFEGRWYPFGLRNKAFRISVECEGCHTPFCFNEHECLERVSAEMVFEACREILEK